MRNIEQMLMYLVKRTQEPCAARIFLEYTLRAQPGLGTFSVSIERDKKFFNYDPAVLEVITQDQLNFAINHELLHIVLGHLSRVQHLKNKNKANRAADIVVNDLLDTYHYVKSGCFHGGSGWDIKPVLRCNYAFGSTSIGQTLEYWYALLPDNEESIDHCWNSKECIQGESDPVAADIEKTSVIKKIMSYTADGRVPRHVQEALTASRKVTKTRIIERIDSIILKDVVSIVTAKSYKTPNRRHTAPLCSYPGKDRKNCYNIMFAIDTSGSISPEQFHKALATLYYVIKTYAVTVQVVFCDTEIRHTELLKPGKTIDPKAVYGGGGTNFQPVLNAFNENKRDKLFYYTDGECSERRLHSHNRNITWLVDGGMPGDYYLDAMKQVGGIKYV